MMNDPIPYTNYGQDHDLKDRHQSCMNLAPDPQTILMRCQFADEIRKCSEDQISVCSRLVHDQHMQHQGWLAVVANLEDSINAFRESWQNLNTTFQQFLEQKQNHHDLLMSFPQDLELLSKIPILPELYANMKISTHGNNSNSQIVSHIKSLFDWINQKNSQNNLHDISEMCIQALNRFGPDSLDGLMNDAKVVISRSESSEMKEIKGLADRLFMLDKRLEELKKLKADQKDLSDAISNNYKTYKRTNDPSIIPDLCKSHAAQLDIMMRNYQKIREIRRKCTASKQELSCNIHCRLKWVMDVEKQQAEVAEKLIVYRENIRRLKSHMEIVQQIHNAPELYIKAVAEVIRRKNFSQAYIDFCHLISSDSRSIYYEESKIRREFINILNNHFLSTLFVGVTDSLPPFALDPPSIFDDALPSLEDKHLELMNKSVPELVEKLNLKLELESTHPGQILSSYLRKVSSNSSSEGQIQTDPTPEVPIRISQNLYKFNGSTFVDSSSISGSISNLFKSLNEIKSLVNYLRNNVKENISQGNDLFSTLNGQVDEIIKSHIKKICSPIYMENEKLSINLEKVTNQMNEEKEINCDKIFQLTNKLDKITKLNDETTKSLLERELELDEVKREKANQETEYLTLKKKESEMNSLLTNLKLETEQARSFVQVENALLKEEVDKLKMRLQHVTEKTKKEMRENHEKEMSNALKMQSERLAAHHKLEMETLRSRFRLASSIERAQDPLSPESVAAENLQSEITQLRSLLESKESEIIKLKQDHENEIQALKQVQYNEAVSRIRNEKDQVISVYRDKIDQLTKQLKEKEEEEKKRSSEVTAAAAAVVTTATVSTSTSTLATSTATASTSTTQERTGTRIGSISRFGSSAQFNDKVAILR